MTTVEITGLNHEGAGVGRLENGMVVFVPGALPGERVSLKLVSKKKNYALARDLAYLTKAGFNIGMVQPVDMFPHTAHVECVVSLKRKHSP